MSVQDREAVFRGVQVSDKYGVGRKKATKPDTGTGLPATKAVEHDATGDDDNIPTDEDEDPALTDMKKEDKEGTVPLFWMEMHPKA